jgi:pyridoxal phosphate enzyme (YggS family)
MALQDRYKKIQDNIAAAAAKAKRDPKAITLVAVTKNASPESVKTLVEAGHRDFGESRVQQLQQRAVQVDEWLHRQQGRTERKLPPPGSLRWHMIGHLQRNKVRLVMSVCAMVHSVDSLRLAEEIGEEASRLKKPMPVLLEVNVAEESTKFGVAVGAAMHLAEQIDTMDDLQMVGLMAMAPYSQNPENARPHFARLRELFEEIRFRKIGGEKFRHLSMGMSGDYQVAVEEGATMVRIGTALFG